MKIINYLQNWKGSDYNKMQKNGKGRDGESSKCTQVYISAVYYLSFLYDEIKR